jgi:hypothetical protein
MAKGQNPYPLLWELFWSKVPVQMRNRYWLTSIAFALWITCCDKATPWTHIKLYRSISQLQKDKMYYNGKMQALLIEKNNIDSSAERFAREQHFMRAPDEDVFIIDNATQSNR